MRLPNRQKDFMFEYFIQGMEKSAQATLRQMYNNSRIHDEMNHRREMEELKKEVAEYVISHLSATLDVSDIVDEIEDLRRAIDSLGQ